MIGNFLARFSGLYRMVRKYRHAVALFSRKEGPAVPFCRTRSFTENQSPLAFRQVAD